MPMPMPVPVLLQALPGMQSMMTMMMKQKMKSKGVASIEELRGLCQEADVKMIGCQMTVDLFGWKQEDFIPEISEWAGAATYLSNARGADITLFI